MHVLPVSVCISSGFFGFLYNSKWIDYAKLPLGLKECVDKCEVYSCTVFLEISLDPLRP